MPWSRLRGSRGSWSGHLVQRHAVAVVNEDHIVELLVAGEGDSLVGNALLQAAVTAEHRHLRRARKESEVVDECTAVGRLCDALDAFDHFWTLLRDSSS